MKLGMRVRARMLVICVLIAGGCSTPPQPHVTPTTRTSATDENWVGIYSSPKEIGGFSGTVLEIQSELRGEVVYRLRSYSDVVDPNDIREDWKFGTPLIESDRLYVPVASGYIHDGKPSLLASITRYTRMAIRGRTVLLRDDALKVYREQNRLYDYGILIKVDDQADPLADLNHVKHESIKVLYEDPAKPWRDPFVNGPNPR